MKLCFNVPRRCDTDVTEVLFNEHSEVNIVECCLILVHRLQTWYALLVSYMLSTYLVHIFLFMSL
jgi:hypothetical protein